MNILLSFTGFHDPFVPTAVEGEMETGPVLTVVAFFRDEFDTANCRRSRVLKPLMSSALGGQV
jgi:hypothetical protein